MKNDKFLDHTDDEEEYKSKSQLKREVEALQDMGKRLLSLKPEQIKNFPLSDDLIAAIEESTRIKQREAQRRHLQYIGKLMKREDIEGITAELEKLDADSAVSRQHFHKLEKIRDTLANPDTNLNAYCAELVDKYPGLDIQTIRQLVRNHFKEVKQSKPPASLRKLFKYLREHIEI